MEWISKSNILIVGLGLMGGSYAKAFKRFGYNVYAIDQRQEAIDYAIENGIIDDGSVAVTEELVKKADTAIFALYPGVFKEWIEKYQQYFKSGIYITDVTGENAKKAGLQKGDYIEYVEDQKIDSVATLKKITQSHKVGDTLTYVVTRNGQPVKCQVTLEDASKFTSNDTTQNEQ